LAVDLNPPQHFVFDLESIAGIEEIVLCKEGVGSENSVAGQRG
jgi:hypothetical protein